MYSRVYVEITNICNMHCSFCHGHHRAPRRMTEDEFAHILTELRNQTGYIYYHLMGEPLTHPLLPHFLDMAGEAGFRSVITTNGTLLSTRGESLLAAATHGRLHKVSVSLHSFEEGSDDSFEQYLTTVVDFAAKAADRGVIMALRLWNRGCGDPIADRRNDRVLAFLRECYPGEWHENWKGARLADRLHLEWGDRFAWPDMQAPVLTEGEAFCHGMLDHFGLLSDGTVVPCCLDSEGTIRLGNVFETPLSDILASPRARAMADGFRCRRATEELCRRCGYARKFV